MPAKKHSKEPKKQVNLLLKYSQLGFQLFVTIGVFAYLGYRMDNHWREGSPLWIIVMMFVGTAGAFYNLYRSLPKE